MCEAWGQSIDAYCAAPYPDYPCLDLAPAIAAACNGTAPSFPDTTVNNANIGQDNGAGLCATYTVIDFTEGGEEQTLDYFYDSGGKLVAITTSMGSSFYSCFGGQPPAGVGIANDASCQPIVCAKDAGAD